MTSHIPRTLVCVLIAWTGSACDFERDSVAPGYYGATQACSSGASGGAPSSAGARPSSSGNAGAADAPTSIDLSQGPSIPTGPMSNDAGIAGAGGVVAMKPAKGSDGCDLSGRWLVTMHLVLDAIGMLQYAHEFNYFEIEQHADTFTVKKGLSCGFDSVGVGDFATMADFRSSWSAATARVKFDGWTGTSTKVAAGCKIDSPKWYYVRGATIPHYLDANTPLPTAEERASNTKPGWEDWDGDGHPGITGIISGIVNGKIFAAPRIWLSLSGDASNVSQTFKLSTQWNQEQNVMAYDGTPLLSSEAVRAADASLHFTQFARLSADQATGDDAAICKAIVKLAPLLTPAAAGN